MFNSRPVAGQAVDRPAFRAQPHLHGLTFAAHDQPQLIIARRFQVQAALADAAPFAIRAPDRHALRLPARIKDAVVVNITKRIGSRIMHLPGHNHASPFMRIVQAFAHPGVHAIVASEFAVAQHLRPDTAINRLADMLQVRAIEVVVGNANDAPRIEGDSRIVHARECNTYSNTEKKTIQKQSVVGANLCAARQPALNYWFVCLLALQTTRSYLVQFYKEPIS